jgi:copper chaperone CopZ
MTTTHIKIATLRGATDAAHLEKALEAVPRVQSVRIDPAGRQAIVQHEAADPRELALAVKQLGYSAEID